MCVVVVLSRPGHEWPLLLGANREEMRDRPSKPPGRHWPDRPEVLGGLDELAGGSWLGVNDHGVVAVLLNRTGSLGPDPDKRSRGELVLEALEHADAIAAVTAFADLRAPSYRPFNLVIVDNRDACWVSGDGRRIRVAALSPGLSMLTAHDIDDPASPRVRRYLNTFRGAVAPDPASGDWSSWTSLLAERAPDDPAAGMVIGPRDPGVGYGTVSSTLIALPAAREIDKPRRPIMLYADGAPDRVAHAPIGMVD